MLFHGEQPGKDIGLKALALGFPHGHKLLQRLLQHRENIGGQLLLILLTAAQGKDIRQAADGGKGEIIRQGVFLPQGPQGGDILPGQRMIHGDGGIAALHRLQGEGNFHLAAGNGALQGALEAILQKGAAARGPAGKLEVAVIDRTDLDGDAAAVQKLLIPSVAGHTAYHSKILTFQMK